MDKILKWSSIVITVGGILIGGVAGYARLQGKVDSQKEAISDIKSKDAEQDKKLADTDKEVAGIGAKQDLMIAMLSRIDKKL